MGQGKNDFLGKFRLSWKLGLAKAVFSAWPKGFGENPFPFVFPLSFIGQRLGKFSGPGDHGSILDKYII
jgi:hypothetical protein